MFVILGWEGGTLGAKNQETNSQIAPLTLKIESKGGEKNTKMKTFNISILEKLNFPSNSCCTLEMQLIHKLVDVLPNGFTLKPHSHLCFKNNCQKSWKQNLSMDKYLNN